jgi:hypothetical protein
MGNTEEKLMYLNDTKNLIKSAIEDKGVDVGDGAKFREYAGYIGQISSGGSVSGKFHNVDFVWRDAETGEIVKESHYVKDGHSISKPVGFNEYNISAKGNMPALYYTHTSGDVTKLGNVTENLTIQAEYCLSGIYAVVIVATITALNRQATLNFYSGACVIEWGDGTTNEFTETKEYAVQHNYQQNGTFKIRIFPSGMVRMKLGDGNGAFYGAYNPSTRVQVLGIYMREKVAEIRNKAISDYPALKDLVLGFMEETSEPRLQIGTHFGANCMSLTYFPQLPKTMKTVPDSYGSGSWLLETIPSLPDGVTKIGNYYFGECASLLHAPGLPDSITEIGSGFYSLCVSLRTTGPIGSQIRSVGDNYFLTV